MSEPLLTALRWIVDIAAAVLLAAFGFVMRRISRQDDRLEALRQSLAAHKLHAAETFVAKQELREMETRLAKHMDDRFDDLKQRIRELGR